MKIRLLFASATLVLALLSSAVETSAEITTYPPQLDRRVFVHDVHADKITIYAPVDFGFKPTELDNMNLWAQWACRLYNRIAEGPLNHTPDYEGNEIIGYYYLYACAIP